MLPASIWRWSARPLIGDVTRVHDRLSLALSSAAWSATTVARSALAVACLVPLSCGGVGVGVLLLRGVARQHGLGLRDGGGERRGVDLEQQRALVDVLPLLESHRRDLPGDARHHGHGVHRHHGADGGDLDRHRLRGSHGRGHRHRRSLSPRPALLAAASTSRGETGDDEQVHPQD